jgi:hypothetical protein
MRQKTLKLNTEYSELEIKTRNSWFEICNKVVSDAFYEGKNVTDTIKELSSKYELKIK